MNKIFSFKFIIVFICSLFFAFYVEASTGTISNDSNCSQETSCASFIDDGSFLNLGCTNCNIEVSDTGITGFAWGENTGWINFNPTNGGVSNSNTGELSGFAWGENTGWINFNCVLNGGSNCANSNNFKVEIDPNTGDFSGYAWSQNYGYIRFECPSSSCVNTSWRYSENVNPTPDSSSGGSSFVSPSLNIIPQDSIPHEVQSDTPLFPDNPPSETTQESNNLSNNNSTTGGKEIISDIEKNIIEKVREKVFSLDIKDVNKKLQIVSSVAVVVSGVASVATLLFLNPLSAPEMVLIPFRLWSLFLTALGLKKKIKPWGTVYDSITKQPLDPVYVSLVNLAGEEVTSSITDIDGRYGFFTEPGVYKVVPQKTNYLFPSNALSKHFRDEFYQDLYFGDYMNMGLGEIIVKNIPMDPVNFDWNEFAKNKNKLFQFYSKKELIISRISNILFGFGFGVATTALLVSPEIYNIIIFGLYILMFILRKTSFKLRAQGRLVDTDGSPMSFAMIRVCSMSTNVEIAHKVADKMGRYHMLLPNGTYYVKIEKKNDDASYSLVHTSGEIKVIHGVLNKVFNI